MRARVGLPVVVADAMDLLRRSRIPEGDDRVVPNAARKDIAKQNGGPAGACEGDGDPAALAGVVFYKPRFRIGAAAVLRPGKEQRRSIIALIVSACPDAVALVDPGREDRTVAVQRELHEALAFRARCNGCRLVKAAAFIDGVRVQHLAIEVLVPENREGDGDAVLPVNDHARAGIRSPIELERLIKDRDGR